MSRFSQRGAGLIEPLIAIVILGVGILGIARFQVGTLMQTTDAQARLTATGFADELATLMRIDATNAACYTVPQAGACAVATAKEQTEAWAAQVKTNLPGFKEASASIVDNEFVILLTWQGKAFQEERQLEVRTDVRP